jgi:protein-export membrane protein SecD
VRRTRALWASLALAVVLAGASAVALGTGAIEPLLGLDLQGGVAVILSAPDGTPDDVMERALENIRNRVDAFGVGEPDIFLSRNTIEVQIPGSARSTIEPRAVDLACLVSEADDGQPVSYGCADDRAAAQEALDQLEVRAQPSEVCLRTDGEDLGCFGTRADAEAVRAAIVVAPASTPTPTTTTAPSPTPTASVGPAPPPSRFCLVGVSGEELACYDSRAEADAAREAIELEVTARTWCVVDASGDAEPTPTPTPTPSPSPSPTPAGLATLDRTNAADPPCGLADEEEADAALAAIEVRDVTTRYCVVSSAGEDLGCYVSRAAAEERERETGQQRLLQVIGETARLEERVVLEAIPPGDPRYASTPITCETAEQREEPECSFRALEEREVVYPREDGAKLRLGPVVITGANFDRAQAELSGAGTGAVPEWQVLFELDGPGAEAFADATTTAVNAPSPRNQIAIVVDRVVISDPVVQQPITNGVGVITGGFTEQESKDLATQLNAGALPVELTRQSVRSVSPTLGDESLRQSIVAGLVGLGLLFLYLIAYYRILGIVASVGMAIWSALALGLVALAGASFGYALTLAGVAGLLISLGVTADSYIVFFERMKDEIRNGRSPRAAVQPAFRRAFRTLIAADVVALIAAGVLYVTAVSSVRGFALTLGVATFLDVLVIWFYKRPAVFLLARSKRIAGMRHFGLLQSVEAPVEAGRVER